MTDLKENYSNWLSLNSHCSFICFYLQNVSFGYDSLCIDCFSRVIVILGSALSTAQRAGPKNVQWRCTTKICIYSYWKSNVKWGNSNTRPTNSVTHSTYSFTYGWRICRQGTKISAPKVFWFPFVARAVFHMWACFGCNSQHVERQGRTYWLKCDLSRISIVWLQHKSESELSSDNSQVQDCFICEV